MIPKLPAAFRISPSPPRAPDSLPGLALPASLAFILELPRSPGPEA